MGSNFEEGGNIRFGATVIIRENFDANRSAAVEMLRNSKIWNTYLSDLQQS